MPDALNALVDHGYLVVRTLAHHPGDGRVTYLCTRLSDDRSVVVKHFSFARVDADWDGYKAHEREIEALRGLSYPGIPRFLDAFAVDDGFCLVQEFINAPSLALRRSWTVAEVVGIARGVLGTLSYLQQRSPAIIHRDIKPGNVLRDEAGRVWVIDFGLARRLDDAPMSTMSAGTPGFMAPEQFFRGELTTATDLYGLGGTLVTLLSGVSSADVGKWVDTSFRFDLKHLKGHVDAPVLAWLERMVEPEATARFRDARAALKALDAALLPAPRTVPKAATGPKMSTSTPVLRVLVSLLVPVSLGVGVMWYSRHQIEQATQPMTIMPSNVDGESAMMALAEKIPEEGSAGLEPRWHGDRLLCPDGGSLQLKRGDALEPGPNRSLEVANGCTVELDDIAVERIMLKPGASLTLRGGQVDRIDVDGVAGGPATRVVVDKAKVGRLLIKQARVAASDTEIGRVDGDSATVFEGTRVKLGELRLTASTAVLDGGRIDTYLSLQDAVLRGTDVEVATRLYIYGLSLVALDRPVLDARFDADDDTQVVVLKAPIATRKPRLGRFGGVIGAGDDLEVEVAKRVAERDIALAAAHLEAERKEKAKALEQDGCALGMACLGRDAVATGRVEVVFATDDGVLEVARAPFAKACFDERVASVRVPDGLAGRLTCTWDVAAEGGIRVVKPRTARFEPK